MPPRARQAWADGKSKIMLAESGMAGRPLRLVCVGKLKTAFYKNGCAHYLDKLRHWRTLELTEVRDGDASLAPEQRSSQECSRMEQTLAPQDIPLVLDGLGESITSNGLAAMLQDFDRQGLGRPCFIIGGPYGLTDAIRHTARRMLALSAMTLPHEMARLMLLEQLYRAESILRHLPYHH